MMMTDLLRLLFSKDEVAGSSGLKGADKVRHLHREKVAAKRILVIQASDLLIGQN